MAAKFDDLKRKASPERMERESRKALEDFEEMEGIRNLHSAGTTAT